VRANYNLIIIPSLAGLHEKYVGSRIFGAIIEVRLENFIESSKSRVRVQVHNFLDPTDSILESIEQVPDSTEFGSVSVSGSGFAIDPTGTTLKLEPIIT
jgi:hypothetical protein